MNHVNEAPRSAAGIEIWFDFASNYNYLSLMRIEAEAARHQLPVIWRPFLLGPIFQSFGWNTSPFVLQKQKGDYVWKDMARQCRKHGLPWRVPSRFPRSALLAVDPGRQCTGLGKRLLDYAERLAGGTWACSTIRMSVIAQRPELLAFYQRRGYRSTGAMTPYPVRAGVGSPIIDGMTVMTLEKPVLPAIPR